MIAYKQTIHQLYKEWGILEKYDKAHNAWTQRKLLQLINMEYQLGYHSTELYKKETSLTKLKAHKLKSNLWCWLTINPPSTVKLDKFQDLITKYVNRKIVGQYLYVLEQRGKTLHEMGKGFHAHLLVERNLDYIPSQFLRNSRNTFKRILNVKNEALFCPYWLDHRYYKDKVKYILGAKTGEGKDVKQTVDIVWREDYGIQPYYTNIKEYEKILKTKKNILCLDITKNGKTQSENETKEHREKIESS